MVLADLFVAEKRSDVSVCSMLVLKSAESLPSECCEQKHIAEFGFSD